ncbi:MAG: PBS lyase HEAT-like repeat protein [Planctomycetes bacterium ADurb.Bin126]|nr:MAG: PBS lyase HEAT-like repeat protein [Planctomycetes bacterium ADurb.Bin126]HOD83800.1 HEAT repeat domain-containing protein [Phycisphaerae bacterium]HQL73990.1 HEAT repeat domain-containing protein [Phycisphaerae bacterium]
MWAASWVWAAGAAAPEPSFYDQEVARFTRLAASGKPALEVEAAQGFYHLRCQAGEKPLLPLAASGNVLVRLETVRALAVCGGRDALAALIDRLDDPHWQVAQLARDALERMTAVSSQGLTNQQYRQRLSAGDWKTREDALLAQLDDKDAGRALAALKALAAVGSARCEGPVLRRGPQLGAEGVRWAELALERFGTQAALPFLASMAPHHPEACWALGRIGGQAAEEALLQAMARWRERRLDAMINLDRLHFVRCEPFMGDLLDAFGLVIFRSYIDELHLPPSAYQQVAAKLIVRTGRSQQVVDLILQEAEGTRKDAATPPNLVKVLSAMAQELKPGFVRNDGRTVAQPLAALPHIIRDRRFVPRLIALLNHPAYIVRIYAAEALGSLHAEEAVEPILKAIRQPYAFVDEAIHASGKHFGDSRYVRWHGYLCIALGKLGGEAARTALEELAQSADSTRDVRYGSVVGLRFLGSPKSLPALEKVAAADIVWNIRQTAQEAAEEIRLRSK